MPSRATRLAGRCSVAILAVVLIVLPGTSVSAAPGDELTVSVLTMDPGDHPFERFGHTALLVDNRATGERRVYNYGTFAFDSVWLLPKFLTGKYRYWLSVGSLHRTLAVYERANRSVIAQELKLNREQKLWLVSKLDWNALDANKYYRFDYYRDNCSTRVRDLVDEVARGALSRAGQATADATWRTHTDRLTADTPVLRLGLDLALTSEVDRRISQWEEMFLPAVLKRGLERATLDTGDPLVVGEVVLFRANKHREQNAAAPLFAPLLAIGLGGAALFIGLAYRLARRAAFAALLALYGLVTGLLGVVFTLFWTATNHDVAHHNENLLVCPPFALVLVIEGARMVLGRAPSKTGRYMTFGIFVFALFAAIAKALPWFPQDNRAILGLFVPLWAGAAVGIGLIARTPTPRALPR